MTQHADPVIFRPQDFNVLLVYSLAAKYDYSIYLFSKYGNHQFKKNDDDNDIINCDELLEKEFGQNTSELSLSVLLDKLIDLFSLLYNKLKKKEGFFVDCGDLPKYGYKYLSNKASYLHDYFDGKLTFVNKESLDDIFDCRLIDDPMFNDRVRLLSMATSNKNKLLWGCYANGFKGFCFQYKTNDIVSELMNKNTDMFCFGKVIYKKLTKTLLSVPQSFKLRISRKSKAHKTYLRLLNFISSCFIKDSSWKMQEEQRIIAIGKNFDKKEFASVDCNPTIIWRCNISEKKIYPLLKKKKILISLEEK